MEALRLITNAGWVIAQTFGLAGSIQAFVVATLFLALFQKALRALR